MGDGVIKGLCGNAKRSGSLAEEQSTIEALHQSNEVDRYIQLVVDCVSRQRRGASPVSWMKFLESGHATRIFSLVCATRDRLPPHHILL